MRKVDFKIEGLYPIFVVAVGLLSYGLTEWVGGNGYLSVYLTGIIVGNSKIKHKKSLVHFLDGISWLMQIMIFFCLGFAFFPIKIWYGDTACIGNFGIFNLCCKANCNVRYFKLVQISY